MVVCKGFMCVQARLRAGLWGACLDSDICTSTEQQVRCGSLASRPQRTCSNTLQGQPSRQGDPAFQDLWSTSGSGLSFQTLMSNPKTLILHTQGRGTHSSLPGAQMRHCILTRLRCSWELWPRQRRDPGTAAFGWSRPGGRAPQSRSGSAGPAGHTACTAAPTSAWGLPTPCLPAQGCCEGVLFCLIGHACSAEGQGYGGNRARTHDIHGFGCEQPARW